MIIDRPRTLGDTDQSVTLYAWDLADGTPFAINHDEAGLELWYRREGAVEVDFTSSIQALAGLDAAHADGGVEPYIEIPGLFRVDVPDAAFAATGSPKEVIIGGRLAGYEIRPVKVPLSAAPLYADGLSDQEKADINAQVDLAIESYRLDHLVAVADDDAPVNNSIIAKLVSKSATADWSDFDNTTDALQALRDILGTPVDLGGGAATLAKNLEDIEAQTDDIGAAGAGLTAADDAILAAIAALNDVSEAGVVAALRGATVDVGVTVALFEKIVLAFIAGKAEHMDPDDPDPATFYAQDGVTVELEYPAADEFGNRPTGADIEP